VYTQSAPSLSFFYSLQRDREPYRQKREKVEGEKERRRRSERATDRKKGPKIRANSSSFRSDQSISSGFVVIGDLLSCGSSRSFRDLRVTFPVVEICRVVSLRFLE
jgi:hypothetical protein